MKFYKALYTAEKSDHERFKKWLKENNHTQEEIALKLDIYSSYLYDMFTGRKKMSNVIIGQLKELGYDVLGANNEN